ncbi:spore germination protein GerW family protein [Halorhabdus sp. SVX81]|uniref:spore germination protein GerW family protein n=1 Tax=Halorhabdus sp. SVX81 TaxID=2978283 RepID=UPI0023DA8771|nr:spore germination protein GerW family protein [Halorhabdus sp. SVX81]
MELPEQVTTIVETIRERAAVETVYGEPIERDGRTVVPVARISSGFGGGFGEGDGGSGVSGGGGLSAKPAGALEITDEHTRFVRFDDRKPLFGAAVLGIAIGWLLGRVRE